jgi:hypothetical protein
MIMDKQDAINLLPPAYADARGKWFVEIIWEETTTESFAWRDEADSFVLPAIGAFVPTIAPFAARLPIATQRAFLRELPGLLRLAGTVYSVTRPLEIFGYTINLIENPSGVAGTFQVQIVQVFDLSEVLAIINFFKPVGRVLTGVQSFSAILLDGTRFFDGTTQI